jgi:hypothetical protein
MNKDNIMKTVQLIGIKQMETTIVDIPKIQNNKGFC